MKILIANYPLIWPGGTGTWTYTIATEMVKRGHSVHILTPKAGPYATEMAKTLSVNPVFDREYDLILISHGPCLVYVNGVGIKGPRVCIVHGTIGPTEHPRQGADQYVAVSNEVQAYLKQLGFDAIVIRNPIDCERYEPTQPINVKLQSVLAITTSLRAVSVIESACKQLGVRFSHISKYRPRYDVEVAINAVDLVVSLGRGCYEAMACGRNVIVFDDRPYQESWADGMITPANIEELLRFNCSGRARKLTWGTEDLVSAMSEYSPRYGEFNRQYALTHFDVTKIAEQYLALAECKQR